jgi:threonine dehydratase
MLGAEDVREARKVVRDVVHRTPINASRTFSEMAGANVHLKLENLQRTGSFKVRGATNKIMSLPPPERERGVVAASAGNHAQGVAFAARRADVPATIVMPEGAPISKAQAVRSYGADLVLEGADYAEAAEHARRIAEERGATKIPAFDDEAIMAGQGTLGLEILEDLPDVDAVVTGVGGGGLISGLATVMKDHDPTIDVVGVQPEGASSLKPSLEAGEVVTLDGVETIADGLAARAPGERTFEVIRERVDDVAVVSDDEIAQAILLLLERAKNVVEGAGAASLAAVLDADLGFDGDDDVVAVLSGGNIDVTLLDHIIRRGLGETGRSLRFRTVLEDKPGELGQLATLLADLKANIREIQHHRGRVGVGVDQATVELVVDARGPEHVAEVVQTLEDEGYPVEVG